ncbi:FadR/GntR family transcriptional regulator [Streptomyces sp. SID3343]|uniref:FadR/GntR family transcriptional regulator n=1 Tax=Streptomyces sp. SID3343 TaxID=2690260 RepID=UPI001369EEF9|nr:FadR/GntR family transcriptional regulator [Streptomyces sp. SID3343]MYW04363.1 FCD domain-containing protein [Streptomyces sp. SID3343]
MAVTDEAIDKIKEMIVSGELKPGDKLPKEADLATKLGLSRNSLREAVKALSLIQILDVRQGDGTYVTSLEPGLLMGAIAFVVDFHHDKSVLDFLQVRRILEPAATALAADRIDAAGIAELRRLAQVDEPQPSTEQLIDQDLRFHQAIAGFSGNLVLCSLLDSLSSPTMRARVWRGLTQGDSWARTVREHQAIVDALESGDAEAARAWSTAHIAGVEQWLRKMA